MANRLLFILVLISSLSANAKSRNIDFDYRIRELDVDSATRSLGPDAVGTYWQSAADGDVSLSLFDASMLASGGNEGRALDRVDELSIPEKYYSKAEMAEYQNYCDSMLLQVGVNDPNVVFKVLRSDDINLFSFVSEGCFVIAMTSALLENELVDDDMVKSYLAHEVAHWALCHPERKKYADVKKDNLALQFGVHIAFGLIGDLIYISEADTESNQGKKAYGGKKKKDREALAKVHTDKLMFHYSPEQVYQADLYACRLMQKMELSGPQIAGLALLGTEYESFRGKTHPEIKERISFLRYVNEHPEEVNTKNRKLAKKLAKKLEKLREKE